MRSPLLLCGFGCVCVLLLMAHATPALADAGVSPPSSVPSSRSAPARPTGAHRAHTVEFDADEIEGAAADDSDAGEVILENTDEQAGAAGASPKSTGDTDATSLLDVFKEPLASTIPARAFQADREAVPFDWLHLHYEARIATEHDTNNKGATQDDEEDSTRRVRGRLLDSTRKLGRSPLVFQLNSGQVHTAMEQALIGARIGERRTVTFPLDATSRGRLPALSVAEDDDEVTVVMEIVRFDEDIKEITLEDRFWNLLPMLAFAAFMGFRIMRGGAEAVDAAVAGSSKGAAGAAAVAAARAANQASGAASSAKAKKR